jgi:hypothetical protein
MEETLVGRGGSEAGGDGGDGREGNSRTAARDAKPRAVNPNLHARSCSVCGHPRREEIEGDFLAWRSPQAIAKEYKLGARTAVYRHARAMGLMERRFVNLRAALGRIIERAGEVPATAWAVVAAVRACAKINARGQWTEREESNEMSDLLEAMNPEELLAYAEHGTLPGWFHGTGVEAVDDNDPPTPGLRRAGEAADA